MLIFIHVLFERFYGTVLGKIAGISSTQVTFVWPMMHKLSSFSTAYSMTWKVIALKFFQPTFCQKTMHFVTHQKDHI